MERIYFDYAATTPVDPRVLEKMMPYFTEKFGNPNSQHFFGRETVSAVDDARDAIAACIGAKPSEIYFTSGCTDEVNWALSGSALAFAALGRVMIVSAFELLGLLSAGKEIVIVGF